MKVEDAQGHISGHRNEQEQGEALPLADKHVIKRAASTVLKHKCKVKALSCTSNARLRHSSGAGLLSHTHDTLHTYL